jgi:N-acylglucosamine 2-epimerase
MAPALLDRLRRHLVLDVAAWWDGAADDRDGGVFSCWSNDGVTLVSRDKYVWSQGRWAWLMARYAGAARRGLLPLDEEQCRERARRTAVWLRDRARLPDGSFAYATDAEGRPKETLPGRGFHTSIFADLFAALGFAAVGAETGEEEWQALAEEVLRASHARIAAGPVPTEPYPTPRGFKGFDLPMILVGVGTEVHRATRSEGSAAIVRWAVERMERHRAGEAGIAELIPDDPADTDTLLARQRTPGHVLEACWFLLDAADTIATELRSPSPLLDPTHLADIAALSFDLGWDGEQGGLLRYVDKEGGAPRGRRIGEDRYEELVVRTWDTKLWWPNAEALYAMLLFGLRTGREDLMERHARLDDYVMTTFPAGTGREWVQIRDRAGRPLNQTVALPVKDPFHVARALLLSVELLADRDD